MYKSGLPTQGRIHFAPQGIQNKITVLFPVGLLEAERLSKLVLYLLEFRRMRSDLVETYKPMMGLDKVDAAIMFPLPGVS